MQSFPIGVVGPMSSSDGCAAVCLAEILTTTTGNVYYVSEQDASFNSIISGAGSVDYKGWLVSKQEFTQTGTTQTDTASISVQNLSGNTVQRDIALAYDANEFIGAFVYIRLFRGDAEYPIFEFCGNVVDADIDDQTLDLSLEGFGNYSNIVAPAYQIDVSCPLYFGSVACGSTAPTPCNQSYGDCSSIERFAGVIIQWDYIDANSPLIQITQPEPSVNYNPARPY